MNLKELASILDDVADVQEAIEGVLQDPSAFKNYSPADVADEMEVEAALDTLVGRMMIRIKSKVG